MALLDLIWEASCTTKAGRKQKWTLTNYLRSEAHYSRWEFTNAVVTVVQKGNVQKLEWLLAHFPGYVQEDSVVEEAAKFGHLNVLQFFHRHCNAVNGPTLLANDIVAEKVTYDVVASWGADTLVLGSENGHPEVVQWLVERTTSIDELTTTKLFADAGKRGDIALLEWLVARGLTYDECFVVRSASTEALEWIVAKCNHSSFFSRSSGQEVNNFLNDAARSAARVGRVDILESLHYCDDKLQKLYCSARSL